MTSMAHTHTHKRKKENIFDNLQFECLDGWWSLDPNN